MKKILLALGTAAAVVAPLSAVVACSQDKAIKNLFAGQTDEFKDAVTSFMSRYQSNDLTPIRKGTFIVRGHNSSDIYFDSKDEGTVAVTNFYVQSNGDFNLTVNVITNAFEDNGIEMKGSYRDIRVSGNINKKDDFNIDTQYSTEHYIGSMRTNTSDRWIYFPKNSSQTILSLGEDYNWTTYLNDKISNVISDTDKTAQEVLDAANNDLAKFGLTISEENGKPTFVFNTSGREIERISVSKI